MPVVFIGADGHGAVCLDRDQPRDGYPGQWPFRLARLARAVPAALQRMALQGPVGVAAADETRFQRQYYPRLRQAATLTSSDGSVSLPEIGGPELVLSARVRPMGTTFDLSWAWEYRIGDSVLRAPVSPDPRPGGYPAGGRPRGHRLPGSGRRTDAARRPGHRGPAAARVRAAPAGPRHDPARRPALPAGRDPAAEHPADRHGHHAVHHRAAAPADGPARADRRGHRRPRRCTAKPARRCDRGRHHRGPRRERLVRPCRDPHVEAREVPFRDVFLALSQGDTQPLLPDGAYFSLDQPELQTLPRLIDEARSLQDARRTLRISRFQAGLWDELADARRRRRAGRAWQRQVAGLLAATVPDPPPDPAGLRAELRPYQQEGFDWLAFLYHTSSAASWPTTWAWARPSRPGADLPRPRAGPGRRAVPGGRADQCGGELGARGRRFAPDLHVVPISATPGAAASICRADRGRRRRGHLLRPVPRSEFDAYAEQEWAGLMLDEAQFVKNHQSKIYQCARRLTPPSKLAITGTPLENNLMELWSLLSITAPGLFPSPSGSREYYRKPIEKAGRPRALAQLRRRIRPLMLRRTKEQVLTELPAKQEQVLELDLNPRHREGLPDPAAAGAPEGPGPDRRPGQATGSRSSGR